jgi:hypothetical protein
VQGEIKWGGRKEQTEKEREAWVVNWRAVYMVAVRRSYGGSGGLFPGGVKGIIITCARSTREVMF